MDQRNLAIDKALKKNALLEANKILVEEKNKAKLDESNIEK